MAYRYTNTDKWQDAWFSSLSQIQMLIFIYLCDNCDCAGFIEVNYKRWASDLNSSPETIEGALKGLQRGLTYSVSKDCIYLNNFLKHQKNLPLNPEKNMSHRGIIKRFECYSHKFDIQDINTFIEGASKGLLSPYGIGNGNGIGNEKGSAEGKNEIPSWDEFKTYVIENDNTIDLHDLELKYKAWKENNWKDGYGKVIKNWKSKILNTIPHLKHGTFQQTNQNGDKPGKPGAKESYKVTWD